MSEQILLQLNSQEEARFWRKVRRKHHNQCWPWIAKSLTHGYGSWRVRGTLFRAPRVAYVLGTGGLLGGLHACHTCDNRRCCNPNHIEAKTRNENMADMAAKGRHWKQGFVYVEPAAPVVADEELLASTMSCRDVNFRERFERGAPDACWEWQGVLNHNGYGILGVKCKAIGFRRDYLAHRLSYELHTGEGPDELHVLHSCDNPPCVNPAHLRLGTHQDNMRDMWERSSLDFKGTRNGRARLKPSDVRRIRGAVSAGESRKALAEHHGVHVQTIHDIVSRKSWSHIT